MTSPIGIDDIELHVFGPGYGEGLLLHVGHGDWIVVDSCVDTAGQPSALKWLRHVGVDPATAVKLVVATHWHDDHVRGLAEVFRECSAAEFVCSGAMLSQELLALAYDAENAGIKNSSGVDELRGIADELQRRRKVSGGKSLGLGQTLASANSRLFQRLGPLPCEVWSLSPSSAELQAAMNLFAEEFNKQGAEWQTRRRIVARTPNTTSVVLWISVGQRGLLLGADLEESGSSASGAMVDAGWSAIVSSSARPQARSSVFKIPHHGSPTGHHDGVWDTMLEPETAAVVTPFLNGRVKLPRLEDCERILSRTPSAYISTKSSSKRYKPTDKVVKWAMHDRAPRTRNEPGHVVLRASSTDASSVWRTELTDGACTLREFASSLPSD